MMICTSLCNWIELTYETEASNHNFTFCCFWIPFITFCTACPLFIIRNQFWNNDCDTNSEGTLFKVFIAYTGAMCIYFSILTPCKD